MTRALSEAREGGVVGAMSTRATETIIGDGGTGCVEPGPRS